MPTQIARTQNFHCESRKNAKIAITAYAAIHIGISLPVMK
jgi:hypothetical protein